MQARNRHPMAARAAQPWLAARTAHPAAPKPHCTLQQHAHKCNRRVLARQTAGAAASAATRNTAAAATPGAETTEPSKPQKPHVVVIGAGVIGLTTALRVLQALPASSVRLTVVANQYGSVRTHTLHGDVLAILRNGTMPLAARSCSQHQGSAGAWPPCPPPIPPIHYVQLACPTCIALPLFPASPPTWLAWPMQCARHSYTLD